MNCQGHLEPINLILITLLCISYSVPYQAGIVAINSS